MWDDSGATLFPEDGSEGHHILKLLGNVPFHLLYTDCIIYK